MTYHTKKFVYLGKRMEKFFTDEYENISKMHYSVKKVKCGTGIYSMTYFHKNVGEYEFIPITA